VIPSPDARRGGGLRQVVTGSRAGAGLATAAQRAAAWIALRRRRPAPSLSYLAGLTAVRVGSAAVAGAVLLFRLLTWFLPIPLGLGARLLRRRGVGRIRQPAAPAGAPA
jgi:hypothetical protein